MNPTSWGAADWAVAAGAVVLMAAVLVRVWGALRGAWRQVDAAGYLPGGVRAGRRVEDEPDVGLRLIGGFDAPYDLGGDDPHVVDSRGRYGRSR